MLITASGLIMGPPIYMIADEGMEKEAIDVVKVRGLGPNTATGSIVFVKNRACNRAFYKWFITTILVSFVDHSRATYSFPSDC